MKMETNRYDYNTTVQWTPQQNQFYEGGYVTPQARQQQLPRPQNPRTPQSAAGQKPRAPEKMPKARALALAHTFKQSPLFPPILAFPPSTPLSPPHHVRTSP